MEGEEDGVRLMEEVAVLDFDMLCAAVALQTQGVKVERRLAKEEEEDHGDAELGGVQRMWEGGVLGCLEDRRIAMEAACCPCCRFGSNMGRAGLGPCFLQGTVYLSLLALALLSLTAFGITEQHYFMYLGVAAAISVGLYAGYFRARIRKLFNIRLIGTFTKKIAERMVERRKLLHQATVRLHIPVSCNNPSRTHASFRRSTSFLRAVSKATMDERRKILHQVFRSASHSRELQ
ncbi:hypothetical protein M5K25_002895 [Dendrobium thyrsiflorum]|uniref:Transmembrane protein n=1 Tax=Dendrobium thyrsiflorum TaxID=117978 RepID=A0ABD0VNK6_DENTH